MATGELRRFDLRLPEPALCRIHVVDEHRAPIGEAEVSLRLSPATGWIWRLREKGDSNPRGRTSAAGEPFEIEVAPAHYEVIAAHSGLRAREFVEVLPTIGGEVTIVLPIGNPRGRVEGRLIEVGTGQPVAGGTILAVGGDREGITTTGATITTADADGRFVFEGLIGGRVLLTGYGPQEAGGRGASDWCTTTLSFELLAGAPFSVELPLARQLPDPEHSIAVDLRLRDRATGARLMRGAVALFGRVGRATLELGTITSSDHGVIALRIPPVESCFVSAAAPDFNGERATHRLKQTELPIVDGSIDATLELEPMKRQ
ncbi:MAG: hypothetical protein EXS13_04140 [Planctomycetes bacterium]|nr:hypothetical protein [Planctomycetota bacterium]